MQITKHSGVAGCEKHLADLEAAQGDSIEISIPSNYEPTGLEELWTTIVVGTACRANSRTKIRAAGINELSPGNKIISTLPALTALQLSGLYPAKGDEPHSPLSIFREICAEKNGLMLRGEVAHEAVIVEPSPLYPVSESYRSGDYKIDQNKFHDFFNNQRRLLEIELEELGLRPSDHSARESLLKFLRELHTNAFEYSLLKGNEGETLQGITLVRIGVHLDRRENLASRFGGVPEEFSDYVQRATDRSRGKYAGLMEASISDFGPGILDHFLKSSRGEFYKDNQREQVLKSLVTEKLSSKYYSSSGLGMKIAISAARKIKALVSLRTDEFWGTRAFDEVVAGGQPPELSLRFIQGLGRVSGTHWQIFWPLTEI